MTDHLSPEPDRVVVTSAYDTNDFELLTDVLLPCLLFTMLGSLVWFLLDMVAARFEAPLKLLRLIVFFFMMAVVGIARLQHRNSELSAGVYGVALTSVMALFAYLFSYGGGAFGGGYGGRHPAALMMLIDALVVAIWFGAHYLVEQTAIDPDDETLQTAGMLSSEEWATHGRGAAAIRKRPHPGRAVMYLTIVALGVFGGGQRLLAGHPSQDHAFWCMVVYLGSAMLVLSLSSLTGLELYLRGRGVRMPGSVIALWLILSVPLAAAFLAVAHAVPKIEPRDDSFKPKLPAWMARFALPDRDAAFEAPWLGDSPPSDQPDAYADGGHDEVGREGGEPGRQAGPGDRDDNSSQQQSNPEGQSPGQAEGGAGNAAGPGQADGAQGEGDGGEAQGSGDSDAETSSPEGEEPSQQQGDSEQSADQPNEQQGQPDNASQQPSAEGEDQPQAEQEQDGSEEQSQQTEAPQDSESQDENEDPTQESDEPTEPATEQPSERPERPESEPILEAERMAKLIGLLIALALLAVLLWKSSTLLRGRLAAWRDRRREAKAARPVRTRDPFVDPFSQRSPFRDRPPADTVVHVYRAMLAYCELLGKPRRPEHTAHEFLYELPAAVESWRPMIVTLTELYEAVEYTPDLVGDEVRDELRPIWERLMQAVREVRR